MVPKIRVLCKMFNDTELLRLREHCAVRLDNVIIIIGGDYGLDSSTYQPTREIWTYNLYTDEWKKHAIPMERKAPDSLRFAVAVAIEGTIYTFGGYNITRKQRNALWTLKRSETGDFSWKLIKYQCDELKESPSPREGHTGWEYAGKLWVFGGEGPSPESYLNDYGDTEGNLFPRNNQLLCYGPHTKKWTNPQCFGEIPLPRTRPCSTIIREKVWLFGGHDYKLGYHDAFFQLNMHSLTWMQIQMSRPSLWPPTYEYYRCTLTATDNQLVLHWLDCTWIMDLTSHSWRLYSCGNYFDRFIPTATLGLKSNVVIIGGYFDHSQDEMAHEIFHVMLEPKCLKKLAVHTICKHQMDLPWKHLPKKLINLLGISDKRQGRASVSSSPSSSSSSSFSFSSSYLIFLSLIFYIFLFFQIIPLKYHIDACFCT